MMDWKIPLFDTDFGQEEIESVTAVLQSGWLTMGERVKEFEARFAQMIGVKHAICVSSCTAALHLAYKVLGLCPGDNIICPSLTFVATANAATYMGARPVFADVASMDDWLLSVEKIDAVKTPATKAICVVHYAGYPCAMDAICEYANKEGLRVIEDCAHAPGGNFREKMLGSWGDVGCFSFFSNKNMASGEGGMVTTNDDELAERIRLLRSHGMTSLTLDRYKGHAHSYDVTEFGYNYRPTEITAALGIIQLNKLAQKNEMRKQIVRQYRKMLNEKIPEIRIPFVQSTLDQTTAHIMPILLPENISRKQVIDFLMKDGIQTSIHYRPIHTFFAYKTYSTESQLPLTSYIGDHCLTLPLYPGMTAREVEKCIFALEKVFGR